MHEIEVTALGATCTCGWSFQSLTGSEAQWVATKHAEKNRPSIIRDRRFDSIECSQECLHKEQMGEYADPAVWHHMNCPNHTSACCLGPVQEED